MWVKSRPRQLRAHPRDYATPAPRLPRELTTRPKYNGSTGEWASFFPVIGHRTATIRLIKLLQVVRRRIRPPRTTFFRRAGISFAVI